MAPNGRNARVRESLVRELAITIGLESYDYLESRSFYSLYAKLASSRVLSLLHECEMEELNC